VTHTAFHRLGLLIDLGQEVRDAHRFGPRDPVVLLEPRQVQQVFDDALHALGLGLELGDHRDPDDRAAGAVSGQGLEITADHRHGGPELVRDIGDEVATDLIGAIEPGDVAGHHERLGLPEGHHVDAEKALGFHRRGQLRAAQLAASRVVHGPR